MAKYYMMTLSPLLAVVLGASFDKGVLLSGVSLIFYGLLVLWTLVEKTGVADKEVAPGETDLLVKVSRAGWLAAVGVSVWDYSGGSMGISLLGAALFLAGVAIRYISMRELKEGFTYSLQPGRDRKMVDTGIYRYLRHPSYTGMVLLSLAIPVIYMSLVGMALMVASTLPHILVRIRKEEEILMEELGADYIKYMEDTKKLVPFIW
jgi:protein-S-isoprenylcysteine O-methyltransferase Ste14